MYTDETPISELGLSETQVANLFERGIRDYGTLCCTTLGDLKSYGFTPDEIGNITNLVKENIR